MLVISRHVDEEIVILDPRTGNIIAAVMVTKILHGDRERVKLGVTTDRSVPVHRGEIQEQK